MALDHMPCENLQTCQGAAGRGLVGWSVRPYLVSRISVARPLRYRISQWPVSRISYLEVGAPCLVRQQQCLRARHAHHLYVIHHRLVFRAPPPGGSCISTSEQTGGSWTRAARWTVRDGRGPGGSYAWSRWFVRLGRGAGSLAKSGPRARASGALERFGTPADRQTILDAPPRN